MSVLAGRLPFSVADALKAHFAAHRQALRDAAEAQAVADGAIDIAETSLKGKGKAKGKAPPPPKLDVAKIASILDAAEGTLAPRYPTATAC